MTHYMVGWLPTEDEALQLIDSLESAGLTESQVGILLRQHKGQPFIGKDMSLNATRGAVAGGAIGGIGGAIFAAVGAVAIPGVGPLIAGGIAATVIAGVGGGALTGGQFAGMFPSFRQEDIENHLREGNVMVVVEPGSQRAEVQQLFARYKVVDPQTVDLEPREVRQMQSPQSTAAIGPDANLETHSEGLSNSKAYLAAHPEAADDLYEK